MYGENKVSSIDVYDDSQMIERGEQIVKIIAVTGIIFAVINVFLAGNILRMIVSIAISLGLLAGKNWVRVLYIVLGVIGAFVALIIGLSLLAHIPGWLGFIMLGLLAVDITFIALLIGNKNVITYFEYNKCTC
jgi:hypothetical protein